MSHTMTNCNASPTSSDPMQTEWPRESRERAATDTPRRRHALWTLALAVTTAFAIASVAIAGEYHSNPWLLSWIPATCCVTNDCCWEVSEQELRSLPDDEWEEVDRTGAQTHRLVAGRQVLPLRLRLRQCRQALGQASGRQHALPVRPDAIGGGVLPKATPGALTR